MSVSTGTSPELDPSVHVPAAAPFAEAAWAGDLAGLTALFTERPDPELHLLAGERIADLPGIVTFLQSVVESNSRHPVGPVLLAHTLIHLGWQARTGDQADNISTEQFETFADHLRKAEALLIDVCALDPANSGAWSLRQLTALGLELGVGEGRRRHDHVVRQVPEHLASHRTHLQMLCPKWFGTWDAAGEFVRATLSGARPGSALPTLVADLQVEHLAELSATDRKYHLTPAVLAELGEAAEASVFHPEFVRGLHDVEAHSAFAAAYCFGGHHDRAVPHFRALGNFATRKPWSYFGDPGEVYRSHRATADKVRR